MASTTNRQDFEHFCAEIQSLQEQLRKTTECLDRALEFYQENVFPIKRALALTLTECSKLLYGHYKKPATLSPKEVKHLKAAIANLINKILAENADAELIAIIEAFAREEMVHRKGEPEAKRENFHQESASDLELPKTERKQELDPRQKKELLSIFRQLAKIFHPDLEQDPEKRLEKEELMKSLIDAYENRDLHKLLSLEKEWIGSSDREEQLEVYNSVLQEQIEALRNGILFAYLNPKYRPLHVYGTNDYETLFLKIGEVIRFAKIEAENCQKIVESLKSDDAEQVLRNIIAPWKVD